MARLAGTRPPAGRLSAAARCTAYTIRRPSAITATRFARRLQAWRTSNRMTYESSSAASDVILAPFGCASSGRCSRPPRAARRLRAWRCARPVPGRRTSAFTIATTPRGGSDCCSGLSPAGRASARRLVTAAGCEPERALRRSRVAGASPREAALLLPQRQLRPAPTPASSRGCSGLARAARRVDLVRSRTLKSAPQDARAPTEASAARARRAAPRRTVSWRSPGRPSTPASGREGAASGSPRTVSAQIVLFAAPGRDDRRPRIPGGAATWSFVGGVLALRSESVRACVALAVPWRREWPPEPGLSGGWTWTDSKPVVTTGAEIQTAACPRAIVALAGGDRTPGHFVVRLPHDRQVPAILRRHPSSISEVSHRGGRAA